MHINYKLINNLTFSIFIAMGVIACGGGGSDGGSGSGGDSSSGGSDSASGNSGSGGCVTFPRAKVGQIAKRNVKDASGTIVIASETEVTAFSTTSTTQKTKTSTGGFDTEVTLVQEHTIANNYIDVTKHTSTLSLSGISFDTVTTYDPYIRGPIDKVCEGETWTSTYTEQGSLNGSPTEPAKEHSQILTIEAVNVSKTTALGTFNTFRVKSEDGDFVGTTWRDVKTGYDVFSEFADTAGDITGSMELIEKNF